MRKHIFSIQIFIRKFSFASVHPKIINVVRLFRPQKRIFQRPLSCDFKSIWFQLKNILFRIFLAQNHRKSCFLSEIMSKYVKICLQIRKNWTFKFSQTISDIINGIFFVVSEMRENHKKCYSALHFSEATNFSASFRYWPWAFGGSLYLRIGSSQNW